MDKFFQTKKPCFEDVAEEIQEDKDADTAAKRREYEQFKRVRQFQDKWLDDFPWLEMTDCKMYCKVCRLYDKAGTYSTGCTTMHRNSIRAHGISESHVKNMLIHNAKKAPLGSSTAEKALRKMTKETIDKMSVLFRNAHALAKNARPFSDFQWMCALDAAKGLSKNDDNLYRSDKQAATFIKFIAEVEQRRIKDTVREVNYISIITDGSTDSSYAEAEIIYIRWCHKGTINVKFLSVKNVEKADAKTISEVVMNSIRNNLGEDAVAKIVGMGTDGAKVMTGRDSGVVARIRKQLGKVR